MHILLPPSETKRSGGGNIFAPSSLSHDEVLGTTRAAVREALVQLSQDEEAAAVALKLGTKNRHELQHNLRLDVAGSLPAIELYTGVLYDALDVLSLDSRSRNWLAQHVSVQSALFGLLAASDEVPAYRLSASSRLRGLPVTLKRTWIAAHQTIDWAAFGWVLDLRSKDYAALAPVPQGLGAWLHIVQRTSAGEVRALNHFNKAAKGDLLRRLALDAPDIQGATDLLEWSAHAGLQMTYDRSTNQFTLTTELGAPRR